MMNSEVGKWDADFIGVLFIQRFLKSLPTSVEVDNSDASFITVELGNWFAEFIKKIDFFRSW